MVVHILSGFEWFLEAPPPGPSSLSPPFLSFPNSVCVQAGYLLIVSSVPFLPRYLLRSPAHLEVLDYSLLPFLDGCLLITKTMH